MASVQGKTSIKIDQLINDTIISGRVTPAGQLILTSRGGSDIVAGSVVTTVTGPSGDTVYAADKVLNANPYFEILNGTTFASWQTFWQNGGATVAIENVLANVYGGAYSAKLTVPSPGSQRLGTTVFSVQPTQMVRVRARMKANGPITGILSFASAASVDPDPDYFATNTQFATDYSRTITAADGWVLLESVFIVPAGKTKARAWATASVASGGSTTTVWVDNVEVIPVLQSYYAANPLIQNFHAVCNTSNPIATLTVTVNEQSKLTLEGYLTIWASTTGLKRIQATCNGVTSTIGELYFNEANSHKAIPLTALLGPLPAGTYSITITTPDSGLALDANDFYNINVREIMPVGWQAPAVTDSGWITVGSAGAPAFQNGWTHFDARTLQYRKIGNMVKFRGIIKSGTIGATIFTLPAGFRPPSRVTIDEYYAIVSNNAFGSIGIDGAGTVQASVGSNAWMDLAGVRFYTD